MRLLRLLIHPSVLLVLVVSTWLETASAACRIVQRGLSRDLIIKGTILRTEGASPPDSVLLIQSGKITHVGDACGLGTRGADASVLDCSRRDPSSAGPAVISPGFINTHEHIDYSTVRPFPDIGERVRHRHDWRLGSRNHTLREAPVNGTVAAATAWGELRHVFSGTTSLVGGEMVPGLARNLDFADGLEDGLAGPAARYVTFPLDDPAGIMRDRDCDYGPNAIDSATAAAYNRVLAHVGEGVDEGAANEFACLSNATYDVTPAPGGGGLSTDVVGPNFVLVHALGLTEADFGLVARRGAKVVWSPRSNMYLYGKTLDASYLLQAGITVALGTDWLPSGSATMAREAVCAASVMREVYGVEMEPKTLWEMATINSAVAAGFEDQIGSLEVGKLADIVIFGSHSRGLSGADEGDFDPFAQAIFAPQEQIELVLRGGKVLLASSEIRDLASGDCETVPFGETDKVVCVADELGMSFRDFEASLGGVYPAILPEVPPYEPTCKPL